MKQTEILVVGAGPAGLTAGIYAARSGHKALVMEKAFAGGQMALTSEVENYPGFSEPVSGMLLAQTMEQQAVRFGCEVLNAEATGITVAPTGFEVATTAGPVAAAAVIVCTGVKPKPLGVPGEKELSGRGVSYCAVIIGEAAPTNVGMASIQQPTRYLQVGTQVSPAATVQNYGDAAATFTTHLVVNDTRDSVIYHDSTLVTNLNPGATTPVEFASWTPTQFDLFTSTFYTALAGDSYPGDDTMLMKSKCFHDGTPIRIGPPNREVTVNSSFTSAVSVVNNGSYGDNMGCLLVIHDSAGAVVYAESATTGTMLPDDTISVLLPPTSITMVGTYTATAVITCADDFYPVNDTFRLTFDVTYELMYDDGGYEAFYWVGRKDNDKFYVRYTPTIPAPYAITGGRIYVNLANQVFDYVSICRDAAGLPDTTAELGRVENVSTPTAPGWITFDYDITRSDASDVWMVIHWPNTSPGLGIGADATRPIDLRSYMSSNQDPFRQWTTHDWMARLMQSPDVGVSEAAGTQLQFRLLEPKPNPFRSAARLNYEIPTASRIALRIYDRSGRLVAVPTNGQVGPGRYSLSWHATDGEGRPVAPGVYFCRLLNFDSGASSVQKLTLVR